MDKETIVELLEDTMNVFVSEKLHEGICAILSKKITAWESNNGIASRDFRFMSNIVTDYIPEFTPETFGVTEVIFCGKKRKLKNLNVDSRRSTYWWPLNEEGLQHRINALKYLIEKYR